MGDLASWACWTVHLRTPQLDIGVIATRRKYIPPVGDQYQDIFIVQTDDVEGGSPELFMQGLERQARATPCTRTDAPSQHSPPSAPPPLALPPLAPPSPPRSPWQADTLSPLVRVPFYDDTITRIKADALLYDEDSFSWFQVGTARSDSSPSRLTPRIIPSPPHAPTPFPPPIPPTHYSSTTRHPPPATHLSSPTRHPPPLLPPCGCRRRTSSPSTRMRCAFSLGFTGGMRRVTGEMRRVAASATCGCSLCHPRLQARAFYKSVANLLVVEKEADYDMSQVEKETVLIDDPFRVVTALWEEARHLPPPPATSHRPAPLPRRPAPPRATPRHLPPPPSTSLHHPPPPSTSLHLPPQAPGLKEDSDARAWANWRQRVARFLYWAIDGGLHPGEMTSTLNPKPKPNHDPEPNPSPKPNPRPNPDPNQAR